VLEAGAGEGEKKGGRWELAAGGELPSRGYLVLIDSGKEGASVALGWVR